MEKYRMDDCDLLQGTRFVGDTVANWVPGELNRLVDIINGQANESAVMKDKVAIQERDIGNLKALVKTKNETIAHLSVQIEQLRKEVDLYKGDHHMSEDRREEQAKEIKKLKEDIAAWEESNRAQNDRISALCDSNEELRAQLKAVQPVKPIWRVECAFGDLAFTVYSPKNELVARFEDPDMANEFVDRMNHEENEDRSS